MKKTTDRLDVVLFGIGDLRTDDHGGLKAAIEAGDSKILPLVILDSVNLANIPGAISSTLDTAAMVSSALLDLQSQLQTLNLNLKVKSSDIESAIKEITDAPSNATMLQVETMSNSARSTLSKNVSPQSGQISTDASRLDPIVLSRRRGSMRSLTNRRSTRSCPHFRAGSSSYREFS